MINKGKYISVLMVLLLLSCGSGSQVKVEKKEKEKYPEKIAALTIPSGFNNEFVKALKDGKKITLKKPLLRIMGFSIPESFYKAIGDREIKVDDLLKSEIANTGKFGLLGTDEDIKAVIAEQNKMGSDEFNDDGTLQMGELLLAGYTLTGAISESYPKVIQSGGHFSLKVAVSASITITNAVTGAVDFTKQITSEKEELLFVSAEGLIIQGPRNLTEKPINSLNASGSDIDLGPQYREALRNALVKIVAVLEEKYPAMGEVVGINGNEVVTTITGSQGVKEGDFVFIVRVAEPLKDSFGKIVGFNKNVIGAAKIKSVEDSISVADTIILKDPDIAPQKNDIVISATAK